MTNPIPMYICLGFCVVVGLLGLFVAILTKPMPDNKAAAERARRQAMAKIVCPHCHVAGQVQTTRTKVKDGISGGKATGAIITAGASVWLTGLAQKKPATLNTCGNCNSTWTTF
jgi:hypothetical protein